MAILFPWTKMHVIVSLDKSPPWTKVSLDNCLLGLMSPRTNISLDKCPLDNRLLGQLSPWTHGPWTNVSTPLYGLFAWKLGPLFCGGPEHGHIGHSGWQYPWPLAWKSSTMLVWQSNSKYPFLGRTITMNFLYKTAIPREIVGNRNKWSFLCLGIGVQNLLVFLFCFHFRKNKCFTNDPIASFGSQVGQDWSKRKWWRLFIA